MFDPSEFRDEHGKWSHEGALHALAHALKKTKQGDRVQLKGKTSVSAVNSRRLGHGGMSHRVFVVNHSRDEHPHAPGFTGRTHDQFHNAHEAARHALNQSARSTHPDSLGGTTSYPDAQAYERSH